MTARCRACFLGFCLALAAASAPPAEAGVELLSHRAFYGLSLADGIAGGVTAVRGGLVMEWRDSCEGPVTSQRLGFIASYASGGAFAYDVRFSSWEAPDHGQLRFTVRSFDDGTLLEQFRGEARLDETGGRVTFAEPSGKTLALPAGTLFPTAHMRALIEGAERGELLVSRDVFDGSGVEGLSRITAVIGKPRDAAFGDEASGLRRWPVSLAYHDARGDDDLPEFEVTFLLSERGVMHDLVLNYGDFAIRADLEQLETFPAPAC